MRRLLGALAEVEGLERNGTATLWEKAVFYHFVHTVMLFLLASRTPLRSGPWFST